MSGRATTINTKIDLAITAQEAGDYPTAITYLKSAKMLIAGLPDTGHGANSVKWRGEELDAMIRDLRLLISASAGITRQKIEYKGPDSETGY